MEGGTFMPHIFKALSSDSSVDARRHVDVNEQFGKFVFSL